jgi:hypothetical protein
MRMGLNAELKAKWVAALKSGEYKQGQGVLYDEEHGTHCCLGVLCRVAGVDPNDGRLTYKGDKNEVGWLVPPKLAAEVGLDRASLQHLALQLNDRGVSFKEIAANIEEGL